MHGLKVAANEPIKAPPNELRLRQSFITYGTYQVGLLEGFETGDPEYGTLEGAQYYAYQMSIKQHAEPYPAAYAVWDNETGAICSIHYLGNVYS